MPTRRLLAVSVGVLALALPTAAQAGTVTGFPPTYTGADVAETVNATTSGHPIILQGDEVLLGGAAQCTPNPAPTRLDCQPATTVSINTLGGDDTIVASALSGTNLLADGGVGDDEIRDGAGNDTITGGAGGDRFSAGPGSDVYNGGDGDDTIYYSDRAGAVTIALNGTAVSGEAGEGDTVGGDV